MNQRILNLLVVALLTAATSVAAAGRAYVVDGEAKSVSIVDLRNGQIY